MTDHQARFWKQIWTALPGESEEHGGMDRQMDL